MTIDEIIRKFEALKRAGMSGQTEVFINKAFEPYEQDLEGISYITDGEIDEDRKIAIIQI